MILDELIVYAEKCIRQEIPSCQKHVWACQRFLGDVQRTRSGWIYHWDEQEAAKIVRWFSFLRHSKGILAGQPIELTVWQKFSLCQLYGWRRNGNNRKRFRKYFKEVGRKNAKSQEEAGIVLYEIATQSTRNGEIYETYCAGTKRDQSKIIFNECINMLTGSPLRKKFKITNVAIKHIKSGSFLVPLCKDDGRNGDGTNPALLVLDEYHQHSTTEFYDLGLGANNKEPLLMIITTAGKDLTFPCYTQEYAYCSRILDPSSDIENDEYFVDICEADVGDDIGSQSTWIKANPIRMSYPEGIDKISGEYEIAKSIPEKLISFKTKCLNMWCMARQNGYMDMAKWKACEVSELPVSLEGLSVYVGFDMSAKIDLTSVAFVLPVKLGDVVKYIVFSHSFIPNYERVREHIAVDKAPYDSWVEDGYITVTDSEVVDQGAVMDYVFKTCEAHGWSIEMLCFDPNNTTKMELELSSEGYNVQEVFQSYKHLNEATQGFREQVYERNVLYLHNPVLNYAMSNAVVRTYNGLIKIDKDATRKRIDPVDAVLCGFKLALYHEWEDYRGMSDAWLESDQW